MYQKSFSRIHTVSQLWIQLLVLLFRLAILDNSLSEKTRAYENEPVDGFLELPWIYNKRMQSKQVNCIRRVRNYIKSPEIFFAE